jgi:hypothetical protein
MATCGPGECKELEKIHEAYGKTHETMEKQNIKMAEQTTTLTTFIDEVRRDRQERREDMGKLFSKVNAVDKALEGKADKDKTVTKSGATILIGVIALVFTALGFAYTVFG